MDFSATYNFLAEVSMVRSICIYLRAINENNSRGGDSMRRSLSVILDEEIHELLRDVSAMEGRSMSEIIREVVRKEVKRSKWRRVLPFL